MKRADGRKVDEVRPVEIKAGVIDNATGSAMVKMGRTIAMAGVYGPREMFPKFRQKYSGATIQCRYMMLPFSTDERCRPGPNRRSTEISKVIRHAFEAVVFVEEFPKTAIDVYIDMVQADAGTRTAAINAASVALADAGIPMKDMVASVAVGKIDGEYVVDIAGKEEETTDCDLPVAYLPNLKKFSLLQMDGELPAKDVKALLRVAAKACEGIYEKQKAALNERWMK